MKKYDDASWHVEGKYPRRLSADRALTHIGFFLAWAFRRGFAGVTHRKDAARDVQRVIDGALTGARFLAAHCDGKLTAQDLDARGNAFARTGYKKYLAGYRAAVDPDRALASDYHTRDDQRTYDRAAALLDRLAGKRPAKPRRPPAATTRRAATRRTTTAVTPRKPAPRRRAAR